MSYVVRDWMNKPVIVIDDSTSVTHAMTLMRRRNIHSLVVDSSEGGKISYGIVTTTDIRDKIVAAGRDPAKTTVAEIMTSPVQTASPNWTLQECAHQMHELDIHHMPVADGDGTFIGMISATDIFAAVEEAGWGALG
jgi:CBS domain-containing protein